jgi:formylglycine-generating enzyme required for sulfatase activity
MVDIFISYAREDQEVVKRLAAALELQGWSVFWDRTIPAGETWRSHIGKSLEEARCVVVAWSVDSIESHWVQEEADDARMRNVLIPVLLAPISPPIGFRSITAANLSGWNGNAEDELFLQFRADISRKLGEPPALIEERERQRVEEERKAAELLEKQRAEEKRKAAELLRKQHAEEKRKAAELLEKQRAEEKRKTAELLEKQRAEEKRKTAVPPATRRATELRKTAVPPATRRATELRKTAEQIEKQHSTATSQAEKPTAKKQPETLRIARKRKPLLFAVISLSIITAAAWTAGVRLPQNRYQLTVITTPPAASIEIQNVGQYTPGMQLEAGTYTAHATSPGYQAEERVFEVAGHDVELEMVLQAITYELVVISTPPDASIDIKDVGQYVPGMQLEAGSYTVRATLSGYQAEQKTVEVTEHDTVLELQLRPIMYELTVLTSPPNASIEIQSVGQYTPGMRLEAGAYTAHATSPGYQAEERVFEVSDHDIELEFKLQPVTYALTIMTTPPGASLEIESIGQYVPGIQLETGTYTIRATLAGYQAEEKTVEIVERDVELEFKLQPATYALTVMATPPGTLIEIESMGQYVPGMRLEPGTYKIRATLAGFQTEERTVEVADRNVALDVVLKPKFPLPELVRVPAGSFMMGGENGDSDEQPVRTVHIEQPFYLGKTEVTFDQYDAFAKVTNRNQPRDENWGRGDRPVIDISWDDARAYTAWLDTLTDSDCRLPSEAEWEYAARAGTKARYALPAPEGGDDLSSYANCANCGSSEHLPVKLKEQIGEQTLPVASFPANAWGFHDMHGNAWEWVEDCWHSSYKGALSNSSAWLEEHGGNCGIRVLRGGPWDLVQVSARSASRDGYYPYYRFNNVSFRVLCSSPISDTDH